jgi:hypothetical protein
MRVTTKRVRFLTCFILCSKRQEMVSRFDRRQPPVCGHPLRPSINNCGYREPNRVTRTKKTYELLKLCASAVFIDLQEVYGYLYVTLFGP